MAKCDFGLAKHRTCMIVVGMHAAKAFRISKECVGGCLPEGRTMVVSLADTSNCQINERRDLFQRLSRTWLPGSRSSCTIPDD